MRNKISFLLIGFFVLNQFSLPAQSSGDSIYHKRLFYTCKVWGYVKYFHSTMSLCRIDWDSTLLATIPLVENAASNDAFNDILYGMIMAPGEMNIPFYGPPDFPDSLFLNLHTHWFHDPMLDARVSNLLDTIRVRFRPQYNCYVKSGLVGNPDFSKDDGYFLSSDYPETEIRLLALFRYWNDVEYFFPYTDILDRDWDTTLLEMIPYYLKASDETEYALAVLRTVHHIHDTHGYTSSPIINQHFGESYPRFYPLQAEGKMVVAYVDESVSNIYTGDIILQINGIPVEKLKDSLRPFMAASNESRMQRNLNNTLVRGQSGNMELLLQNENGTRLVSTQRNWSSTEYYSLPQKTGPIWYDTLLTGGCHYGYVDMGRLENDNLGKMLAALWETDAIVFDIRAYPNSTLWTLANYFFSKPFRIANFIKPRIRYPGTIRWESEYIGNQSEIVYEGDVIILFNESTISQAEYTCMGLEHHSKSIKIGSQTAGADGNVSLISLPGNIETYFTGLGTFYPDYTPTQRIGIVPDYEIRPSIQGLREQRDEVLEFAYNCALPGIADNNLKGLAEIKVFPNPADDIIRVQSKLEGQVTYILVDKLGRVIKTIHTQDSSFSWSVSQLNPGLYILFASNDINYGKVKIIVR